MYSERGRVQGTNPGRRDALSHSCQGLRPRRVDTASATAILRPVSAAIRRVAASRSHPHLPELFVAANKMSIDSQGKALRLRGLQLGLLIVAAGLASVPFSIRGIMWGVLAAGVAFAAAFLTEATILGTQPEKSWYQSRAIAESVKSLAWRYAVGGRPFPKHDGEIEHPDQLNASFTRQLQQLRSEFDTAPLIPTSGSAEEITTWMRATRESDFEARRQAYRGHRIDDQHRWYSSKAQSNLNRSTQWSVGLLAVQVVAIGGAVLKGTGIIQIDILGVMAAVSASAVAWLQLKQHSTLWQSYSQAANELATIGTLLDQTTDRDWPRFVDEAEAAISREHTTWRIKRS